MKISDGFVTGVRGLINKFMEGGERLNSAQLLLQSWPPPAESTFVPKRPHLVRVVVDTDIPLTAKDQRSKQTHLKYLYVVDRSKKYPYSSKRQNTRGARRMVELQAAA